MKVKEFPVIWFQASACSGCTVSVLNTSNPSVRKFLIDPVIRGKHVNLVFQQTIMAGSGEMAMKTAATKAEHAKGEYILVVEGAIPFEDYGRYCCVGESKDGPIPIRKTLEKYAQDAKIIIALGNCAAFGGIPAAYPDPTNGQSVNHFLSSVTIEKMVYGCLQKKQGINTPFINLAGCPCHPHWFTETVENIMQGNKIPLDEFSRPLDFHKELIHQNCPRYDSFMDDIFAKHPGDDGCFKEIGCKGRVTYADCPVIKWNNTSWCIDAGTPCIGCANPYFPEIEILEV
jgi:hydrogenase small subunit